MYIGRFVVVGKTSGDRWYLGYRISSRSFPNRRILLQGDRAVVLPTPDAPPTDNPYISYNCLRQQGRVLVVANGSHIDPIVDKVSLGYPLRDALALSLLALDFEHDQYNTPRIAAGLDLGEEAAFLGIVGADRLCVQRCTPKKGTALLIATYELIEPTDIALEGETADDLAEALLQCAYENPVSSLAAVIEDGSMRMAVRSAH